ncbi:hypothetical protein [Acinetobacter rudis]|uniref:Lipoprotein n=1 Tax=Acinetobacter rudis TaxID=632955 RepID=A0AAW8J4V0_9GAMM|nr:hypothetical protein [Acinetobacter rudis]MDQ8934260.1 hypothetical protein [Acinetobacter rudis]MDQ8952583.1 hypothetical protein [Acinetobacter rudis]MDQ9016432.1 hypothetical protein [Acinetobacter rudis]
MKIAYLCLISSLLMACQPTAIHQANQQQSYVCKSLIEGFLKTQSLGQYELRSIQPDLTETAVERTYTYNTNSDITMRLNTPTQPWLAFQCNQQNNHYSVQLIDTRSKERLPLLSLDLPETKLMRGMTAFKIEPSE